MSKEKWKYKADNINNTWLHHSVLSVETVGAGIEQDLGGVYGK